MKNVNILENPLSFTRQGRIRRFSISYRPLKKIHGFFFRKFIYFHHFGKFPARFARKTSLCCIFLLAKLNFTMCACQSTDNWPIFERSYFEKKRQHYHYDFSISCRRTKFIGIMQPMHRLFRFEKMRFLFKFKTVAMWMDHFFYGY